VTKEAIAHAINAIELGLANGAMIDTIIGHGPSQANRDIKLGLDTEQSKLMLNAILIVLKTMRN
jgi:hypothetical protein